MFLMIFEFLLFPITASAADQAFPEITIYFYYSNPCGSCNEEGKFYTKFDTLVGQEKEGITPEFNCYNVFQTSGEDKFNSACAALNIPEDKRNTPMVVIDGKPLIGDDEINTSLKSVFVAAKNRILLESQVKSNKIYKLIYFFVSPCNECAEVKQFLSTLPTVMTVTSNGAQFECSVDIQSYNVAETENLQLVKQYFETYHVPDDKQKVPIVFLKDGYLSGKDEIESGLSKSIETGRCIDNTAPLANAELKPYEWSGILFTGIINGFNPCSISMLLFLVTILISRKANIFKLGMSFIIGKFVAYLALGTILFNVLSMIDNKYLHAFDNIIKYVLLALTLIIAYLNISDVIAARAEKYNKIRLQLPSGLRKINHAWLKKIGEINVNGAAILFGAFALGLVISVGEFLCTGQIYLASILYLMKRSPVLNPQMVLAFMTYILGMLLPLLIITVSVHKGKEIFSITELARKNIPVVKLINAAIFIMFAILIIVLF